MYQKVRKAARKYYTGSYEVILPSGDIFIGNGSFLTGSGKGAYLYLTQCNATEDQFRRSGCTVNMGCLSTQSKCHGRYSGDEVCVLPIELFMADMVTMNSTGDVITVLGGEGARIADAETISE